MKECKDCGNERVMVCHNCTGHDHAAELARVEGERDGWKLRAERAEAYVAGQDVRSDFRNAGEMRTALDMILGAAVMVGKNFALLRAECEAWRAWWDAELPIDLNKPDMYQDVACARQDTDAAKVLGAEPKGGE